MIVDGTIFKNFLERISMDNLIDECIIKVKKEGLECMQQSSDNVSLVKILLKSKAIKSFTKIEDFGISSIRKLIKIVERFDNSDLKIEISNNILKLSSNEIKGNLILPNTDFIESSELPNISSIKNKFSIEVSYIQKAFDDLKILEQQKILLNGKLGKLIVKAGEEESIERTIKIPEIKDEFKAKYGNNLNRAIAKLSEVITIEIDNDYPIVIRQDNNNFDLMYIIAPFIEEEKDEEKKEEIIEENG